MVKHACLNFPEPRGHTIEALTAKAGDSRETINMLRTKTGNPT